MTNPKRPAPPARRRPAGAGFQTRFDDLERRRAALLERLTELDEKARAHPAYKRAQTLLNPTFRRASIAQRAAILQAADWLIKLIDMWTTMC